MARFLSLALGILLSVNALMAQDGIYQFVVKDADLQEVRLSEFEGKVILIVNTASRCGFTPQYAELEAMYEKFNEMGFEILDFPCNQFGNQAPESDKEYVAFCQLNYNTKFRQMHKVEVNGGNENELFKYLKSQKGFEGFDPNHQLTPILEKMFDKNLPGWRESSDIKWNFTKFLVDRAGNVVYRFEPTATAEQMMPIIQEILNK